jgi:hypothetical protein
MPLTVIFGRPTGAPYKSAVHARLTFRGPALFAGEHPEPIARHERHHWTPREAGDKDIFYTRLDIAGPLCLQFRRGEAETSYGPYSAFSSLDGVAYVEGNVFAFEDVQNADWYCVQDRMHWDTLSLCPADEAPGHPTRPKAPGQ